MMNLIRRILRRLDYRYLWTVPTRGPDGLWWTTVQRCGREARYWSQAGIAWHQEGSGESLPYHMQSALHGRVQEIKRVEGTDAAKTIVDLHRKIQALTSRLKESDDLLESSARATEFISEDTRSAVTAHYAEEAVNIICENQAKNPIQAVGGSTDD